MSMLMFVAGLVLGYGIGLLTAVVIETHRRSLVPRRYW